MFIFDSSESLWELHMSEASEASIKSSTFSDHDGV
jgi:hypothetical protein